jgi:circadian clock protein KaiC
MTGAVIDRSMCSGRLPSGILGLDALIGGGMPLHRSMLLCGDIGTGKTTFGLQFLMAGAALGEAGILISVDEKPRHVLDDATRFGWDVSAAMARRLITVLEASPFFTALRGRNGVDARQVAGELALQVRRAGATRLVVDGVLSLAPDDHVDDFVRSLVTSLEDNLGCTTVLTARTCASVHTLAAGSSIERLTSGAIELKLSAIRGIMSRTLLVRKMRGAATTLDPRTFDIVGGRGLVLHDPY